MPKILGASFIRTHTLIYIYIYSVPWHGMPDSGTTLNVFVGAGSASTTGSIDNRSSCLIAALSRNCRVFHFLDFFLLPGAQPKSPRISRAIGGCRACSCSDWCDVLLRPPRFRRLRWGRVPFYSEVTTFLGAPFWWISRGLWRWFDVEPWNNVMPSSFFWRGIWASK